VAEEHRLAAENTRLYEAAESRARELAALQEVGTTLTSTLDLPAVLEAIAESATGLLGAQRCAVFELDRHDQRLHVRVARGMRADQPFIPLRLGQGAAGSAALLRQPVFSPDVHDQPLPMYDEVWEEAGVTLREVVRQRGYRTILAVPLVSKDNLLGAICIYWDEVHAYNGREVRLLTAMAQQAATALENARLYEDLNRKNAHLQVLFETARRATESLDLSDILPQLAKSAAEIVDADASAIRLLDASGTLLEAVADYGLSETFADRGPVKVG